MMWRATAVFMGFAAITASAGAHHSTANFDRSRQTTIEGVVTTFQFSNPHSLIEMNVAEPGRSEPVQYKVFATSKVVLLRYGWRQQSIEVGDTISIVGFPDRDDETYVYLSGIRFADGTEWARDEILE